VWCGVVPCRAVVVCVVLHSCGAVSLGGVRCGVVDKFHPTDRQTNQNPHLWSKLE